MTNLRSFLEETARAFKLAGIESYQADAEQLIASALGISRGELIAQTFFDTSFTPSSELQEAIERRANREPLQHITSAAHFRRLELEVGPGVFVPRPETESVAQLGIDFLLGKAGARALDIGTGSAAIAIALATETSARVEAVEKSELAAEYARRNITRHGGGVNLAVGDFRELKFDLGVYDLVISNPPYIPNAAVPLDPEVRNYDPELALYGGEDGLDLIREIIELGQLLIKPGGLLVLEHADGQSDMVCELLLANWQNVRAHPDPTGRLRAVSATR